MIEPENPVNETERMRVLRRLNILDTPEEERFDRFTKVVKKIFNAPIALITLVDEDRQWFKSKQGLEAKETPREHSFCGHAIHNSDVLIVEDTFNDKRFIDNPLVIEHPNIRFYAGYPLEMEPGLRMGTLCIIDSKPRKLAQSEIEMLTDMGKLVESELKSASEATTDELTGISNRRGFVKIAEFSLSLAKRMNYPITLFYIDLNEFKEINDTYGHSEGDKALKKTAEILLHNFREMDVVGRIGGDEFCVLCTKLCAENLNVVKNKLVDAFVNYNKSSSDKYDLKFSLGYVTIDPHSHQNFAEILDEADRKMYEDKKSNKGKQDSNS